MKIVNKFQMGGQMAQPVEEAPAQQDPIAQIVEMFAAGLQNQDCQLLAEGASLFMELVSAASQPAPIGSEGSAPVFRKGGTISRKR